MLEFFLKYYGLFIGCVILFYFIGLAVFLIFKIKEKSSSFYADIFSKIVVGTITFVVINSIYFTKGKTINLGFLIVGLSLLFLLYDERKKTFQAAKSINYFEGFNIKSIIMLLLVSLFVFLISFSTIYSSENIPIMPHTDYGYYANISNFILITGKENSSINYIFANEAGASPYHYFEIWLSAGISNLFRCNSMLTLMLVTFSIGSFVIWAGLCALLAKFKSLTVVDQFLSFLFLFVTGFYFPYLEKFPFFLDSGAFASNIFSYYKLFAIYWFLIASLLLFKADKYNAGIIVLLCTPIVSISTGIGIWSAVFIYFCLNKIWLKRKGLYVSIITFVLLIFFIYFFYKVFGKSVQSHVPDTNAIIAKIINLFRVKTFINIIGKTTLQLSVFYLPFILILFLFFRSVNNFKGFIQQNLFVVLFFLIIPGSLIGWASMHMILNTVEIFCNVGCVLFNLFIIVIIFAGLVFGNRLLKRITIIVFSLVLLNNVYNTHLRTNFDHRFSVNYLKKIYNLSDKLSPLGAFIPSKVDCNSSTFSYLAFLGNQGAYLTFCDTKTFPVSIAPPVFDFLTPRPPLEIEFQKEVTNWLPFVQYINKQKQEKKYKSIEQSRVDFIEEFKMNYLIIAKNVKLDSLLKLKVSREIVDEKTGERFLLLK